MKHFSKTLSLLVMLALVFTTVGFTNLSDVYAKSVVKSIKVKGAKKKITLKKGDKKTYVVKVKAKKGKTKFSVKSSNSKIARVKKKGKKITITALSVGTTKVTVKSKVDKKKKYVIKVKVVGKKGGSSSPEPTAPVVTSNKKVETTVAPTEVTAKPEQTTTKPEVTTTGSESTTKESEISTTEVESTTIPSGVTTTESEITTAEETTSVPESTTNSETSATTTQHETTKLEETTTRTEIVTAPEETTINPEDDKLRIVDKVYSSNSMDVYFSDDIDGYEVDESDVLVWTKKNEDDQYNNKVNVDYLYVSEDYLSCTFENSIDLNDYVKFEVTINSITYSFEYRNVCESSSDEDDVFVCIKANEEMTKDDFNCFYVDGGIGAQQVYSVENLPEGLDYVYQTDGYYNNYFIFTGRINKKGEYSLTVKFIDEAGAIDTYNVTLLVGDSNTILAKETVYEDYAYDDGTRVELAQGFVDNPVGGGSGKYRYEIVEDTNHVFEAVNEEDEYGYYRCGLSYTINQPGVYTAKVRIYDFNNSSLYTESKITINVKHYYRITGQVISANGIKIPNAIVRFFSGNYGDYEITNENGEFSILLMEKPWMASAFYASSDEISKEIDLQGNMRIIFQIQNVYNVSVVSDQFNAEDFGEWKSSIRNPYGQSLYIPIGTGTELLLPAGKHYFETMINDDCDGQKEFYVHYVRLIVKGEGPVELQ